ncbi:MAG TPA: TIGR01212 family radical SAM protein, partial [Bacteroidetes bacterium]|nr:TIGR01212 family radical SAM protein [Bacteroidota bacterium]
YVEFVAEFVGRLREDIIIERFISESPPNKLIAPKWNGLKNFEVTAKIDKKLIEKDIWQGKYYHN